MSEAAQTKTPQVGRLVDVVTRLNAARRALRLYPPGHVSINACLDNAFASLSQLLETRAPLVLYTSKKALRIAGEKLGKDYPVCQEFAQILYERDIAAVAFIKELTIKDLERFIGVLNEPSQAPGDSPPKVEDRDISHIRMRGFDYRNLRITLESSVRPDDSPAGEDLAFLEHLGQEPLTPSQSEEAAGSEPWTDARGEDLAQIVGKYRTALESAVDDYSAKLERHFAQGATRDRSGFVEERIQALDAFSRRLGPSLSNQLRSFDYNALAANKNFIELDDILGNENSAFIFSTIQQANASDKEISPTLVGLVRKVLTALADEPGSREPSSIEELGKIMKDNSLERLFKREEYENYVVPEYDELLKRLTREKLPQAAPVASFPMDAHLRTFEPFFMEERINWVSLKIAESELLDDALYREVMAKITDQALQMIARGAFGLIVDLASTLQRHMREKSSLSMREAAASQVTRLKSREVILQSIEFVSKAVDTSDGKVVDFLIWQGPEVVTDVIEAFVKTDRPRPLLLFHEVLDHFRERSVAEARSFIQDPDVPTVKRMMMILGRMGDVRHASELLPFADHPDWGVRQEAFGALLQAGHPEGIRKVRELFCSSKMDEVEYAIQTAGRFGLKACVPELLSALRVGFGFTKSSVPKNERIIRALGQIGDPSALGRLEKIARKKWTLHREALAKLKLTLFSNLERYPREDLGELLRIGTLSPDTRIKNLAMHLSNRDENAPGEEMSDSRSGP